MIRTQYMQQHPRKCDNVCARVHPLPSACVDSVVGGVLVDDLPAIEPIPESRVHGREVQRLLVLSIIFATFYS